MKKLYNGKGKRVHSALPPTSPWNFIAALPSAVVTLAAALSPEEKEVLSYLLSGGGTGCSVAIGEDPYRTPGKKKPFNNQSPHFRRHAHPPQLSCGCFSCYKSFWARWDASPNRHVIHHILDAVEESLDSQSLPDGRRRQRSCRKDSSDETSRSATIPVAVEVRILADDDVDEGYDKDDVEEEEDEDIDRNGDDGDCRSSVRWLVSFIGERVWGVWNY